MTGNRSLFHEIKLSSKGSVTFGDNRSCKIIGTGSIESDSGIKLNKVHLVDGLKHNLLSISQICKEGYSIAFDSDVCCIKKKDNDNIAISGYKKGNIYHIDLNSNDHLEHLCLISIKNDLQLAWHRKLGHVSQNTLARLGNFNIVRGLPKLNYSKDFFCDACAKGKHVRSSFKSKKDITTNRNLELVHLDLFGPTNIQSLGGKSYAFVLVDDFSRYTWVYFLASKDETFIKFKNFVKEVQNDKQITIGKIRSDNGGEFISLDFKNLCESLGIIHEFSVARTPQQNGVVERKNRTLVDIARTMLNDFSVPIKFWAEAVNTACYVINRVLIRKNTMKTPYEIWKNLKPNISYFHPFGCRCFILNTKDHLGKFDAKSDEGIFLGYSNLSKAYRVFNKRSNKIEESIHVLFDQTMCEDANLQDTFDEDFGLIPIESMPIQDNSNPHISELSTGDINREKDLKQSAGNSNLEAISHSTGHETDDLDKQAPPHIIQRHPPSQVIGNFNERNLLK
ncbi:Retrovirus-related Pol polyprotein from transposon TNT 1-94 [Linum grandiflorum]